MLGFLLAILPLTAMAQKTPTTAKSATAASQPAGGQLPKIWHSESTHLDFRVEVTNDLFRAEWVNIPATAARQGAYIRTECRRAGAKWVGESNINRLFAIPGAPAGKDTKVCHLTVRFEVDSISPEKITMHSEALRDFDVNACQVRQTSWVAFTWVPKK
jgi:hypothetical protein